ncbi:MAG: efflux RND transporter periplasmic adaptor subunit [Phycisphaerales bacterium]|nr:efflux RND transporter periplasmic adaptor subunit [Phycisphaerales bacterium]
MKALLAFMFVAAAIGGGSWGYFKYVAVEPPPRYRTVEVTRGDVVSTVSATGTIEPHVKVIVGSQVSGTVVKWNYDFNDVVKQGDILLELDRDRFNATVSQRTAAVAVARAREAEQRAIVEKTKLDVQRIEEAAERMAASDFELRSIRADLAAVEASLQATQAQVEAAEADLRNATVELEKTIIRSPIDGVVIKRAIDIGQTVAASLQAPDLYTIANDLRKMQVNAAVSETDIGRIHEGMEAQFRVDAFPGRKFRGVVSQVRYAETVVDNVVTYTTLIDVDNPDLSLRPGMTATILFEIEKAENVLIVPNTALRFDPNAASTASINWMQPGKGRVAKPRVFKMVNESLVEIPLELGLNDGSSTQIVSGEIKDGDDVVTEIISGGAGGARTGGPPMGGAGGNRSRGPRGA